MKGWRVELVTSSLGPDSCGLPDSLLRVNELWLLACALTDDFWVLGGFQPWKPSEKKECRND